jgi:hypothetical protein
VNHPLVYIAYAYAVPALIELNRDSLKPSECDCSLGNNFQLLIHKNASMPRIPAFIGTDEPQPVTPWWVAFPQSPPALHRMQLECSTVVLPVEIIAANGNAGLICLSQPRGQRQGDADVITEQGLKSFCSQSPSITILQKAN